MAHTPPQGRLLIRNAVRKFLRGIPDFLRTEPAITDRIQVDSDGITIIGKSHTKESWSVLWTDIHSIIAFKVDVFTFDRVYLGICTDIRDPTTNEPNRWYRMCHEELRGWPQLLQAIESQYGRDAINKIHSIVFPPFDESPVSVWRSDAERQENAAT